MVTYYPFSPQPGSVYQFQPTLDGQQYTVVITWSVYGQRWYYNVVTLQQQLVLSIALVASPQDFNIDLGQGYFNTPVIFREASQQFEVGT